MVLDKLFPQLAADLRKKMEAELKDWPVDPIEEATRLTGMASGKINAQTSIQKGNTPTPAGGKGEKPTKNKRQGQVTKESE